MVYSREDDFSVSFEYSFGENSDSQCIKSQYFPVSATARFDEETKTQDVLIENSDGVFVSDSSSSLLQKLGFRRHL